jgi:hypothetical protein
LSAGPHVRPRREGDLLHEIARGLVQTLQALTAHGQMQLVKAELEVPFVGTRADRTVSVDLKDFRNVSLLADDIGSSGGSRIWKLCISMVGNEAPVITVGRYDAPTVS